MNDDKLPPNTLLLVLAERRKYEEVILRIHELSRTYAGCEIVAGEFKEIFEKTLDSKQNRL